MTLIYRFADRNVEIQSVTEWVHEFCRKYRVDKELGLAGVEPDISITTTQADIDFERMKSERADRDTTDHAIHYSDAYLETLAVYRKIAERMPAFDTFLFHGSAIAVYESEVGEFGHIEHALKNT